MLPLWSLQFQRLHLTQRQDRRLPLSTRWSIHLRVGPQGNGRAPADRFRVQKDGSGGCPPSVDRTPAPHIRLGRLVLNPFLQRDIHRVEACLRRGEHTLSHELSDQKARELLTLHEAGAVCPRWLEEKVVLTAEQSGNEQRPSQTLT